MTTYNLMNGVGVLGNAPGNALIPVSVAGNPTRASYTLSLAGTPGGWGEASILASVDGQNFLPIGVLAVAPGGTATSVTQELRETGEYIAYFAKLDSIAPGGYTASVTMTV